MTKLRRTSHFSILTSHFRLPAIGLAVFISNLLFAAPAFAQTNTVTVAATDAAADEAGPDAGTFTFTRTGPTTDGLYVYFTVGGNAVASADYSYFGTYVLIAAGQASATTTVTPILDAVVEADETVVVTLRVRVVVEPAQ